MKIKGLPNPIKSLPGFHGGFKGIKKPPYVRDEEEKEERPEYWYGTWIKSDPEWWAIKALLQLDIPFEYQVPVQGGQRFRGGYVIDFVIQLPPKPQPFEIWGGYWHEGEKGANDKLREIEIASLYKVERIKGLYQSDLQDEESVYNGIVRELL